MAKTGKSISLLLLGTAVGVAVGYILATDKEGRQENMERLKDRFGSLRDRARGRFTNDIEDLEEEIYNA